MRTDCSHLSETIYLNMKIKDMTKKDFLKELKDYFTEHEWKEHDEKKVMSMLDRYKDSFKTVYLVKKVEVAKPTKQIDYQPSVVVLDDVANDICELHKIKIEELKVNSPLSCYKRGQKRRSEYVQARAEFCKTIRNIAPHVKLTALRNWFGYRCHSSIVHLLNYVQ